MDLKERLLSRIKENPRTGCWEWQGSTCRGYGRITTGSRTDGSRRTESTHRLSYRLFHGEVPEGKEVCHTCDNPRCINPAHLFAGTRQDNVDDRETKGRNVVMVGESNGRAKLTRGDVASIRREHSMYRTPYTKLAAQYGVHKKTISDAINGQNWKCVLPEPPK